MKRLLIVLLLAGAVRAAQTPVDVRWGYATDSFRVRLYADNILQWDSLKTGKQSYRATITTVNGAFNQFVIKIWDTGGDSAAGYVAQFNQLTTFPTTGTWTLYGAHWPFESDSARLYLYVDSVKVDSVKRTSQRSYGDYATYYQAGKLTQANILIYPQGEDSAASWLFTVDLRDTASTSITPSPTMALVYGYVKTAENIGIHRAVAKITRQAPCQNAIYDVGVSGLTLLVPDAPIYAVTDTAGYFSMYVLKSSSYSDSCGYYNIDLETQDGQKWRLPKVWITGNFNVADSLSGR